MEIRSVNAYQKNLVIGDFSVGFVRSAAEHRMEIPFAGMAFYQPTILSTDFNFVIGSAEPDNNGILLFGSDNVNRSVSIYQNDNDSFSWLLKEQDDSKRISFLINKEWTEFLLYEDTTNQYENRAFREFGTMFSYAVLKYDACVLHGVIMEYDGMGILVTAPSGTGKTTHTRMWRDTENALILNGDRCLCRKVNGIWYAYGMPWSGSSGEYINRRVPISAIVALKQADTNYVEIMSQLDGTLWLMQRIFAPLWECDMEYAAFDRAEELAAKIPLFELHCRPDLESVKVLKQAILNRSKKNE